MAETAGSALLLRRYLGRRMEALREKAELSRAAVAHTLSKKGTLIGGSSIGRMEAGDPSFKLPAPQLSDMLHLYGATEEQRELLLAIAAEIRNGKNGKSKPWWHDRHHTEIPGYFGPYVMFEDSAETIHQVEMELVPGLLQTRDYAEQVHSVPAGYVDKPEIEQRVAVRIERQSLLIRPRAPRLEVILGEAVFHRSIGGPGVMAEQWGHLIKVSEWNNVSVRVLPFSAGLHAGMAAGTPFTILEFPRNDLTDEPLEPPLAYVDGLTGALYLQKPEEFAAYRMVWEDVSGRALSEDASRDLIRTHMEGLNRA